MCQVFEDLAEKWAKERVTEEKKESARRMIVRGKQTLEEIAEDIGLPLEEVRELSGLIGIEVSGSILPVWFHSGSKNS